MMNELLDVESECNHAADAMPSFAEEAFAEPT